MVKILFVCHGNICRSPMAACLFSQMAKARGLDCVVSSAATSREEIGNPMYPPARRKLKEMGVPFGHHRAVQMTREDYGAYDFLLAMDSANVKNMKAIAGGDPEGTVRPTPGTLPIPGTREILTPPMRTWQRAVRRCWTGWRRCPVWTIRLSKCVFSGENGGRRRRTDV